MHIGLAADWWFTLYVNGERVYDTQATGNRSKRFVPDDHGVAGPVKKGVNVLAVKVLSGSNGWKFVCGKPTRAPRNKEAYTLVENEDWRKVVVPPCVKPGTVLDFSSLGFIDAPAGKYGRVVVRGSHFEFENRPGVPVRFYGTNIYGHINFSDRAGAERLASMLVRAPEIPMKKNGEFSLTGQIPIIAGSSFHAIPVCGFTEFNRFAENFSQLRRHSSS